MSIVATQSELLSHAQRFIRELMAQRLRDLGFVSKDGNDIQWFKLLDRDVIQSVYFFTRTPRLPMTMEIGYGCHPAFLSPHFSNNPVIRILPGNEVLCPRYIMVKQHNRAFYREDILVRCPADEHCGIDFLERILPVFDICKSPESCYELHKSQLSEAMKNNSIHAASSDFVDEVLYWDDREAFPYCLDYVRVMTNIMERAKAEGKLAKRFQGELHYLHYLDEILHGDDRQAHLNLLEKRKQRNLALLKKYTGIEC